MSERVTFVSPVALAIREILKDCRNWILFSILWQPDARRQRRTVFQRYQRVLDDTHGLGNVVTIMVSSSAAQPHQCMCATIAASTLYGPAPAEMTSRSMKAYKVSGKYSQSSIRSASSIGL